MCVVGKLCGWRECLTFMTFVWLAGTGLSSVEAGTSSRLAQEQRSSLRERSAVRSQLTSDRSSAPSPVQSASPSVAQPPPPADSDEAPFTIQDFFVEGNTLLPPDQVEAILAPFRGKGRRFSDIEAARAALEK